MQLLQTGWVFYSWAEQAERGNMWLAAASRQAKAMGASLGAPPSSSVLHRAAGKASTCRMVPYSQAQKKKNSLRLLEAYGLPSSKGKSALATGLLTQGC